jgi:starvation-inducible DNA-binding protein
MSEIQPYGAVRPTFTGLGENARTASIAALNQILADTLALRDLYKKHHWQANGPTFDQLHHLYDRHNGQQAEMADLLAERIMTLGGVSVASPQDVAELTQLERPPKGREDSRAQLTRLAKAHEHLATTARKAAREAGERGDDGTDDLLVGQLVRTNELQAWFVSEHLGPA